MEQFFIRLLATIFDAFKAKNPAIAATIVTVLGAVVLFLNTIAPALGITSPVFIEILRIAALVVMGLTGSRTSQILAEEKAEESKP